MKPGDQRKVETAFAELNRWDQLSTDERFQILNGEWDEPARRVSAWLQLATHAVRLLQYSLVSGTASDVQREYADARDQLIEDLTAMADTIAGTPAPAYQSEDDGMTLRSTIQDLRAHADVANDEHQVKVRTGQFAELSGRLGPALAELPGLNVGLAEVQQLDLELPPGRDQEAAQVAESLRALAAELPSVTIEQNLDLAKARVRSAEKYVSELRALVAGVLAARTSINPLPPSIVTWWTPWPRVAWTSMRSGTRSRAREAACSRSAAGRSLTQGDVEKFSAAIAAIHSCGEQTRRGRRRRHCRGHRRIPGGTRHAAELVHARAPGEARRAGHPRPVPRAAAVNPDLLTRILDRLESLEDPLLCWGVVDGGFSTDELREVVDKELANSQEWDLSSDDVIEAMTSRALLVHDSSVSPARWRTRNGETIRLVARLRQYLPGPDLAVRHQPDLGLPVCAPASLLPEARPPLGHGARRSRRHATDAHRSVIEVMTQRDGKHDLLGGFQVRATRHILTALQGQTTTATVVGAGTGSGKTNAFYLPAFSYLAGITRLLRLDPRAGRLSHGPNSSRTNWTRHSRTPADSTRLWKGPHGRPMTIGALYGSTPTNAKNVRASYRGWGKRAQGNGVTPDALPGRTGTPRVGVS